VLLLDLTFAAPYRKARYFDDVKDSSLRQTLNPLYALRSSVRVDVETGKDQLESDLLRLAELSYKSPLMAFEEEGAAVM